MKDDPAPAQQASVAGAPATGSGGTMNVAAGTGGNTPGSNAMGTGGGAPAAVGTGGSSSGAAGMSAGTGGQTGTGEGSGGMTAPPTASSDWAFIGYDIGSSYYNSNETVLTKDNAANLAEIWTKDLGGAVMGAPLQIGDKIYATGPGAIKAYDAATGNELWSTAAGSTGSLGYADRKLYLHLNSGNVAAFDAESGSMLWSTNPEPQGNDGSSSPIVIGNTVLIGGASGAVELSTGQFRGFLSALDTSGAVLWTTYTVPENAKGASIWSSPAADMAAGRAYAGTGNNYGAPATDTSDSFIAFDLKSGMIVWKAQKVQNDTFGLAGGGPDSDFGANPVLYETMVGGKMTQLIAAGNKGGEAHAVRRDDGSMLWDRKLGPGAADGSSGVFVNSAWSGKNILMACNENGAATLYGLDGATGDIAWMRALPGPVWGRMSAIKGVGFVGTGAALEVFDTDTGALIKSFPSKGGTVAGTITISQGRVAFGEGFQWSSGIGGSTLTVLAVKQ
jgi:outer membrane protein assembly factor BamB